MLPQGVTGVRKNSRQPTNVDIPIVWLIDVSFSSLVTVYHDEMHSTSSLNQQIQEEQLPKCIRGERGEGDGSTAYADNFTNSMATSSRIEKPNAQVEYKAASRR